MQFLAPRVQGQDVIEPLEAPPDLPGEGQQAVFLFLPERRQELAALEREFDGGGSDGQHHWVVVLIGKCKRRGLLCQ